MKKYEVVVQGLSRVIDGSQPGDRLPSESELCRQYGVSAMTVRRAVQYLASGGRVETIQGKGTYAAEQRVFKSMTNESFTETMRSQGRIPSTQLLSAELGMASQPEALDLQLDRPQLVARIHRIRFGDSIPLCIEHAVFLAGELPGLLGEDLSGSVYELLRTRYDVVISRVSFRVRARLPDETEAASLELKQTVPCLEAHTLGRNQDGLLVETTSSLYRGDRYELQVGFS